MWAGLKAAGDNAPSSDIQSRDALVTMKAASKCTLMFINSHEPINRQYDVYMSGGESTHNC